MINKITGKCQQFWYFGCDGNENNFLSKIECENSCLNIKNITKIPLIKKSIKKFTPKNGIKIF